MVSGNAEFRVIRNYEIVMGIFLLIIIGIFIYLWKIKRKEERLKKEVKKLGRKKK